MCLETNVQSKCSKTTHELELLGTVKDANVPAISPISHRGSSEAQFIMVPTVSLTTATISRSNSCKCKSMLLSHWLLSPDSLVCAHTYTCALIWKTCIHHVMISQSHWLQCLITNNLLLPLILVFWCLIWPRISFKPAVTLDWILNTSQTHFIYMRWLTFRLSMASFNKRTTSWPSQFETLKPLVQLISFPYKINIVSFAIFSILSIIICCTLSLSKKSVKHQASVNWNDSLLILTVLIAVCSQGKEKVNPAGSLAFFIPM